MDHKKEEIILFPGQSAGVFLFPVRLSEHPIPRILCLPMHSHSPNPRPPPKSKAPPKYEAKGALYVGGSTPQVAWTQRGPWFSGMGFNSDGPRDGSCFQGQSGVVIGPGQGLGHIVCRESPWSCMTHLLEVMI